MTIRLPPATQQRLEQEAGRMGLEPEEFARRAIEEKLSYRDDLHAREAMLHMLDQWDQEDQTDDPAEIARRQREFEEFKQAINGSHSSNRKIYP